MKSMLKFRDIILCKKGDSAALRRKKATLSRRRFTFSGCSRTSQTSDGTLSGSPLQPKTGDLEKRTKTIVKGLQGSSLLESIRETFSDEKVEEWKEQSQNEFDQMVSSTEPGCRA